MYCSCIKYRHKKKYYLTYGTDHSKLRNPLAPDYVEANIYTDQQGLQNEEDTQSVQGMTMVFRDGSEMGSRSGSPEKDDITAL